ncbi:MAG: prepilin-type N-terminal cleavage/methylation domain-containing protein [Verrucomicrobiae bacterium]|nr:prepilin-type N-terminal cleavage/methylation domain-containing protein [Verrucomicrobiae bacterium]
MSAFEVRPSRVTRAAAGRHLRKGVTLVEMLVALAILGILVALTAAATSAARSRGRAVRCLSNLRQWGVAFLLYADDHESFLPRRGQGVQPLWRLDRPEDWFNALPPYLGLPPYADLAANSRRPKAHEDSVFVCPSAEDPGDDVFLAYGMNMNLSPWNLAQPTRLSDIQEPSKVVALGDARGDYSSIYPSRQPYSPVARHSGRVNLLFLDGHAQAFTGADAGCGVGDPRCFDIHWLTGTKSDANADAY